MFDPGDHAQVRRLPELHYRRWLKISDRLKSIAIEYKALSVQQLKLSKLEAKLCAEAQDIIASAERLNG